MHLSDADGVHAEGLEIGNGSIVWSELVKRWSKETRQPTFIPEIWQGHHQEGQKFMESILTLEKFAQESN